MCLLSVSKRGILLTREQFDAAWDSNPDGGGFAYVENGKLIVKKGFMEKEAFWTAYQECQGKIHLFHTRWKSAGEN